MTGSDGGGLGRGGITGRAALDGGGIQGRSSSAAPGDGPRSRIAAVSRRAPWRRAPTTIRTPSRLASESSSAAASRSSRLDMVMSSAARSGTAPVGRVSGPLVKKPMGFPVRWAIISRTGREGRARPCSSWWMKARETSAPASSARLRPRSRRAWRIRPGTIGTPGPRRPRRFTGTASGGPVGGIVGFEPSVSTNPGLRTCGLPQGRRPAAHPAIRRPWRGGSSPIRGLGAGSGRRSGRLDSGMSPGLGRTVVLIPVAVALNIALGSTVQQVLRLPIYMDSLGTVLAGVLAGPLVGMATGAMTNLIWAYVLPAPLAAPTAGPFAITAAVIGLLAGAWGRLGLFRPRPARDLRSLGAALGAAVVVAAAVAYTFSRAYASPRAFTTNTGFDVRAFAGSEVAFAALAAWALFVRRDAGAMLALAAGLATGLVAALVSAPIAAFVFGGVTGFGGDLVIAAFRAAGASLYQATLEQGLLSDPLDKMIVCLLAFLVLSGLPRRVVARFPNGERLIESG